MFSQQTHELTILEKFSEGFLPILIESFLIDRKAAGASKHTILFYTNDLKVFNKYCERLALTQVKYVTPDFLWRFIIKLGERSAMSSP